MSHYINVGPNTQTDRRTDDYRMLRGAAAALISLALLASCAKGGGGSGGSGGGGEGGPSSGPAFDVPALSQNGCLDIGAALEQLASAPESTMVRRQTEDFTISKENHLEKRVTESTAAVAAFATFKFVERPVSLFYANEMTAVQNGCETVSYKRIIPGVELPPDVYNVKKEEGAPPERLHVVSTDGQRELIYELKGPRALEITTIEPYTDPCPPHGIAKVTVKDMLTWGDPASIEAAPVGISRKLLALMDIAVKELPPGLTSLLGVESVEPEAAEGAPLVQASALDIKSLLPASQKDPNVHTCEHKPKPPSGDEPGVDEP